MQPHLHHHHLEVGACVGCRHSCLLSRGGESMCMTHGSGLAAAGMHTAENTRRMWCWGPERSYASRKHTPLNRYPIPDTGI